MRFKKLTACLMMLALCACGGPEKPPYPGIKIGKPYWVSGHRYSPHYEADYDEIGVASWYGPGFHGGRTASGERFDQNAITAAHRTLPLPSIVRVTNLSNGVSAIIKVNDRGPFSHSRIIDLSRGAAAKLGVLRTGTAKVRVQFLERETKEYVQNERNGVQYAMNKMNNVDADEAGAHEEAISSPPEPKMQAAMAPDDSAPGLSAPVYQQEQDEFSVVENAQDEEPTQDAQTPFYNPQASAASANYFVLAGTFSMRDNALNLIDHISDEHSPQVMEVILNGKKLYRVMVGPYVERADAKVMLARLSSIGIRDAKIVSN